MTTPDRRRREGSLRSLERDVVGIPFFQAFWYLNKPQDREHRENDRTVPSNHSPTRGALRDRCNAPSSAGAFDIPTRARSASEALEVCLTFFIPRSEGPSHRQSLCHKSPSHDVARRPPGLHNTEFSSAGLGDQSSDEELDSSAERDSAFSIDGQGIGVRNSLRVGFTASC